MTGCQKVGQVDDTRFALGHAFPNVFGPSDDHSTLLPTQIRNRPRVFGASLEDEAVGAVPVLDDIEPFVDGLSERLGIQIAAKKDGLDRFAQLVQGPVRGVLEVVAGEAPQDRFGLGRPKAQRGGKLDHLIVLLTDQFPLDRADLLR